MFLQADHHNKIRHIHIKKQLIITIGIIKRQLAPNALAFAALQEIEDMRGGAIPKNMQCVTSFLEEMGN